MSTSLSTVDSLSLEEGSLVLVRLRGDDEDFFPALVIQVSDSCIDVIRSCKGEQLISLPPDTALLKPLRASDISAAVRENLYAKVEKVAQALLIECNGAANDTSTTLNSAAIINNAHDSIVGLSHSPAVDTGHLDESNAEPTADPGDDILTGDLFDGSVNESVAAMSPQPLMTYVYATPASPVEETPAASTATDGSRNEASKEGTDLSLTDDMDGLDCEISEAEPTVLSLESDGSDYSMQAGRRVGNDGSVPAAGLEDDVHTRDVNPGLSEADADVDGAAATIGGDGTLAASPYLEPMDLDVEEGVPAFKWTGGVSATPTDGEGRPIPEGDELCHAIFKGLEMKASGDSAASDLLFRDSDNSSEPPFLHLREPAGSRGYKAMAAALPALDDFISPGVRTFLQQALAPQEDLRGPDMQAGPQLGCELREYQKQGLSWLLRQYDKGLNCILGDEPSIGRRIQIIAFLSHLVQVRRIFGFHLVVAPVSEMLHWESEIGRWCPELRVLRVHTSHQEYLQWFESVISSNSINSFTGGDADTPNVVVTSFSMLKKSSADFLRKITWESVVFDVKGRMLRSIDDPSFRACAKLSARCRVILSSDAPQIVGPVVQFLHQTHACLRLLHPDIFYDIEPFIAHCNSPSRPLDCELVSKLERLLALFLLRRKRSDVEGDTLPAAVEIVVFCPQSYAQRDLAANVFAKSVAYMERLDTQLGQSFAESVHSSVDYSGIEDGHAGVSGGYRKLRIILGQLQRIANHPYLIDDIQAVCLPNGLPTEDIQMTSGKLHVLDQMLGMLRSDVKRVLLVSQSDQMLDILEDFLRWRQLPYIRRLTSNPLTSRVLADSFNIEGSDRFICLQSSRLSPSDIGACIADCVIFYDSNWDPQIDLLTISKCRRVGRLKAITVYRLVTKGTFEEVLLQAAQEKLLSGSRHTELSRVTASLHVSAHKKRKRSGLGDKEGGSDCSNEDIEDAVPGVAPSLLYAGARFEWNSSFSEEGLGALFGWHLLTIDGLRALLAGKPHEELAAFRMSEDNAVVRVVNGILVRILSNRPKLDSVLIPSKQPDRAFEVGSSNIDGKRRKLEDLRSKAGEVASIDHSGNVPMILRAARLKAKRVYENQDFCQLCWDGGDLLLCDLCPASYHPKIQCVTNYTCMPVSHHRARWKCPLHKCGLCQQPSEDVKLLFACEICPAAYCESCLAPGAKVVGACARFESMGHRLLSGSVYIHCSKECAYFAANEAENEIRQMDEMNKNRRENSEVGVNGGSAEQPLTSLAEQSKKMVKPRHAYKKVPSDLVASENELPRLNPSAFDEILLRLGGVGSSHLIVRFRNLLEIAGFEERWNNLPSDSQEKFANLIASANRFYESLQQTSDGTINAVINCNRNPVAWMKSLVFSYCGFPFGNNAGPHQAGIVYKIMTKFMDSWTVHLLVGVCALLGIGLVLPILDNSARRGPVSEPIFRTVNSSSDTKEWMQDAISVLLLTLSPQNILHDHAAGSSRAKSPFYILRWLETLMHHCYWQDGQFYCSERNSRSHNESAIISSPTATLSIIAGLYPGFRLHNALGRAAYLDEALKKICATYDVLSKFLSIRIPGSDNRLDSATVIIEFSWTSLRGKAGLLFAYYASLLNLTPDYFKIIEAKVYSRATNGSENPNGYCSEIIQLLEEIRSRALRNTARSAHLPAILKTQATSEQHEPALFRAELCSTSRPCNGAERHVVDASSIESKASAAFQKIRERRFISMCTFLKHHDILEVENAARLIEIFVYSNCFESLKTYNEKFQVLIRYMSVAFQSKILFKKALDEFLSNVPNFGSWEMYGELMENRARQQSDLVGRSQVTVVEYMTSWEKCRVEVQNKLHRSIMKHGSPIGTRPKLSSELETFFFLLVIENNSSIELYKKFESIFCNRIENQLSKIPITPFWVAVSEIGLELDKQLKVGRDDASTIRLAYARIVCLQLMINLIDKLQVPPQLAWDATIILWCKITDYSDVMVNFKAAMVHLMVAASQEIGLTISTSLALACTIAQSIDQYEEQSAQSTPQIDVGKSSFSTVPPAGLQFYGSAGQLEAPYCVGDVNVTPEILSGPPVGVKWYMDDVDSVHKEIETSVCDTSMCPSQFRDLEKYSILVGLFIFGDDPGNIVQLLTGRSAEEVDAYIRSINYNYDVLPIWHPQRVPLSSNSNAWDRVVRPVIEACMSLEKTICARNSMQSFEVECIVTFFDAVRNHGILQKGLSGPMEAYSETFSSFKDAITLIVMWYKSFHLQFVQAFERVVVASETAAKIVRYITSSMTTLSPEVVRKDLAEATDKLSQLIFKLKDLISLRVAIYFPVLLDFEIPKDLTLVSEVFSPR